jgi:ArsR family transcriptional regulator, arsenate/arsenite/antimonite-responsive transcriptional repressor
MENVTQILAALADPIRLRSLALMLRQGDLCVCETCYALEIAQPKASKHLATLRDAGLVVSRRDAQWTFYALAGDLPDWARALIDAAVQGLAGDAIHAADQGRLKRMPGRPSRTACARRST